MVIVIFCYSSLTANFTRLPMKLKFREMDLKDLFMNTTANIRGFS